MSAASAPAAPTAPSPSAGTGGRTTSQVNLVFAALMLALMLAALDQTIVATALPTIAGDLGGLSQYSWVVTAYLLAFTISAPLFGKLGDLYGRKRLFQGAIVLFLVGSALCGQSRSMAELVAFRAVQGLAGGGLIVGAQAIIGDIISPRERGRYQGLLGAVFGVSSIAGPLLGGFFVDHASWRWVFYINVPVGLPALAVLAAALKSGTARIHHSVDYLGAALMAGGVSCIILLTTWGGEEYAWASPTIVGLGLGGVALVALFVWRESVAPEPILPLELFRNSIFVVASAIGFAVGFCLYGATVFLPQYMQIVRGESAVVSGLQLTPMMLGMLVTSIGSGQLISRFGRYKPYPVAGTLIIALGFVLLSRLGVDTGGLVLGLYMFVVGLGLGLVMQVVVLVVQNAVAPRLLGTATSAATFFRSIGGSIGVALYTAVFNAMFDNRLAQLGATGDFDGSPEELARLPADVRVPYVEAFADALDDVFLVAVPCALGAFLLATRLREIPLKTQAAGTAAVSQGLGLSHVGAAEVLEEATVRERAAQVALGRLDELAAAGPVPADQLSGLRGLLEDRVEAWHRLAGSAEQPADGDTRADGWALLVELMQVEREALLRPLPITLSGPNGRDELWVEAQVRIDAIDAALMRLDSAARDGTVPADRLDCLRQMFESRRACIVDRVEQRRAVANDMAPDYWGLAVEVLEAERRELAAYHADDEVTSGVAGRVERDLCAEADLLVRRD